VWVGGFYPRPYYYYYYPYYPESVPSYYAAPYYPIQPAEPPGVVATAPPPRPELPRFGIGVFAGGSSIRDNQQDSSDLGLLARFRLTPGLLIEGQLGKTSFKDNVRVDRRIGGSLIWEIAAHNSLAPYLLAGAGVEQASVNGDFSTTQDFGELGLGLRLALSRNIHLTADVRAGARKTIDSGQSTPVPFEARSVLPPTSTNSNDTEHYTRGQLAAIVNF
jgi:hypothetical protein